MSIQYELIKYKKSDICVFLGCGPTINKINNDQWSNIKKHDVWAINNWVYHPFIVPNFYHIETKQYDRLITKERLLEKKEKYKNVIFLIPNEKTSVFRNAVGEPNIEGFFLRRFYYKTILRDRRRTHSIWNANYVIDPNKVTVSYDTSLSGLIEILYKMKYKKVVLCGVDLNNSFYFWTGNDPKYGKVHHQTNKAHEGKDPQKPHATYKIKDFIIDFNERFFKPIGCEIYIGSKESALFPYLREYTL